MVNMVPILCANLWLIIYGQSMVNNGLIVVNPLIIQ